MIIRDKQDLRRCVKQAVRRIGTQPGQHAVHGVRDGQIATAAQHTLPCLKQLRIIAAIHGAGEKIHASSAVDIHPVSPCARKVISLPCKRLAAHHTLQTAQRLRCCQELFSFGLHMPAFPRWTIRRFRGILFQVLRLKSCAFAP